MMVRTKKLSWYIAALAAVAVLVGFFSVRSRREPPLTYDTTSIDRGPIVAKVTATGTLSALVTVQVGSQVSGRLKEIYVDFNSPVKKGEVIARLDPQLFEAALEQAQANYLAAQGNLTKTKVQAAEAERNYKRNQTLAERKLIASADLDTAQASAEAAKAQVDAALAGVEQARAALHQAQVNLAYTTIVSPIDGVVISRDVDVGQTVAASLQAPTLFVIAENLHKMQVDTSVAEADIGKLESGMRATFTVDAYPSERFAGTVRQVRNAPQTVQNVVTYDAVIDVDNADLKLKPGMTANVTFIYAERDDVLRVRNAALRFRPAPELLARMGEARGEHSGAKNAPNAGAKPPAEASSRLPNQRTLWLLQGEKLSPVSVEVGVSDGMVTEIVSGDVHEGQKAVVDVLSGSAGSNNSSRGRPPFRHMF